MSELVKQVRRARRGALRRSFSSETTRRGEVVTRRSRAARAWFGCAPGLDAPPPRGRTRRTEATEGGDGEREVVVRGEGGFWPGAECTGARSRAEASLSRWVRRLRRKVVSTAASPRAVRRVAEFGPDEDSTRRSSLGGRGFLSRSWLGSAALAPHFAGAQPALRPDLIFHGVSTQGRSPVDAHLSPRRAASSPDFRGAERAGCSNGVWAHRRGSEAWRPAALRRNSVRMQGRSRRARSKPAPPATCPRVHVRQAGRRSRCGRARARRDD